MNESITGVHDNFVKDEPKTVNWTPSMLKRFKLIITKADEAKVETVMFDGNEYLVDYAKYLIEYLETKIAK